MIKIREMNALTDCYRDLAVAVHEILTTVYADSPWTFEQTFADMLREDTTYYLAFSESQALVGFLSVSVVMDEIELTNIAVDQKHQDQGIASLLLRQLVAVDGLIFLEVRASNLKAQSLYQKFGFEAYYQRANYYQNPREDAILMKREK